MVFEQNDHKTPYINLSNILAKFESVLPMLPFHPGGASQTSEMPKETKFFGVHVINILLKERL